MEFFADDKVLAELELELELEQAQQQATQQPRPALLLCMLRLCWQLRQRDTRRALALANELDVMLSASSDSSQTHDLTQKDHLQFQARIMLVRAEATGLLGDFAGCLNMTEAALQVFSRLDDALGCADAHWLLSWLAYDSGDLLRANEEMSSVATLAAGNDQIRSQIAMAQLARYWALTDIEFARKEWAEYFPAEVHALPMALRCWVKDFHGIMAREQSDYVQCVGQLSQSYALALSTGQIRLAIVVACNLGDVFNRLNDNHTAMDWMQRGLKLARQTGWQGVIGTCLKQTGDTLRRLQRFDEAYAMLQESLQFMDNYRQSSYYAYALQYLGDVELARHQFENALLHFEQLERRALSLKQTTMLSDALRGQAQALFELGQPERALQIADATWRAAQSVTQIDILQVMAAIHARDVHFTLTPPAEICSASCCLHYLQKALALATSIENYTIPSELLSSIAREYARLGEAKLAYQHACLASVALEKVYSREAGSRSMAVLASLRTERALAASAHQRELAAKAKRAEILQQTSETFSHLGAIGQEITAHLNSDQVFESLNRHIQHMLEVNLLGIGLMDEDGLGMSSVYAIEDGKRLPTMHFSMTQRDSPAVRCMLERCEIIDEIQVGTAPHFSIRSRMFAPLCVADRVLGAMTIQASKEHTYGKREQMIFRTLCAYTAIALSNADAHGKLARAHKQLQETQQHMVLQGKMAGLGALTAGVAHEINNPTNFVHVAAQNQKIDLAEFQAYVAHLVQADEAPEVVQGFQSRFAKLDASLNTMLNGTERIKTIVRDLRAFTRLDEAEKKLVRVSECLLSTLNLVRTSWLERVEFITEFSDDPLVECWPALLNQVFMNLLVNGCQAIEEKQRVLGDGQPAKFWLRLFQLENLLIIVFEDSGIGISNEAQTRIMEPFYTTKSVGHGMGLGLSIAFGIVQKHGGTLTFNSLLGEGSCFTIQLPLRTRSLNKTVPEPVSIPITE